MSDNAGWCLIESDPGVFSELLKGFGADELECEEVYDLNETSSVSDAYGFIFLFNYDNKVSDLSGRIVFDELDKGIFFAKQTISNACATQSLINILLNINHEVDIGQTLLDFKSFVIDFDSSMKGTALSNSDQIRTVHNSFQNCQLFELDLKPPSLKEDIYHFISYLPINGSLYELDGLKPGPIDHGKIPENQSWIDYLRPYLQKRMQSCVDGKYNIMAVVPRRLLNYERQLAEAYKTKNAPDSYISELKSNIINEKRKAIAYKEENIRRQHNYLPLIIELLKLLAEQGKLSQMMQKAAKLAKDKIEAQTTNPEKKVKFV